MIAVIESANGQILAVNVYRDEHRDAAQLKFVELVADDIEQSETIDRDGALIKGWDILRDELKRGEQPPCFDRGGSRIEYHTDNVYLHGGE